MCQFCVAHLMRGIESVAELFPLPPRHTMDAMIEQAIADRPGDEYSMAREAMRVASPSYWRDICAMPTVLFPFNGLVPPSVLRGDPQELRDQYYQACFYREVMREFGTITRSMLIGMN